jgi:membrane-associated phospholipid phosphatase
MKISPLGALLGALVVGAPAFAEPKPVASPYQLSDRPWAWGAVGVSLGVGVLVQFVPQPEWHRHTWVLPADEAWPLDVSWHDFSNIEVGLAMGMPVLSLGGALLLGEEAHADLWVDAVVWLNTMSVTLGVVNALKYGVGRSRPFVVSASPDQLDDDAYRSFPSGHTAMGVTSVVAAARILHDRRQQARAPGCSGETQDTWYVDALVLGVGGVLAAETAFGRVQAGKHHWSDVLAGGAIGAVVGWYAPGWFSADGASGQVMVAPTAGGLTAQLSGAW